MSERHYSLFDKFIIEFDKALTTVAGQPETTSRPTPGEELEETELTALERKQSAGLMRVNHAGEVSAQALYQGQALTAKLPKVREAMEVAAREENDHLVWCQQRLDALSSHTSVLNPFWYAGSFTLGAIAGKIGDKWSLGFVAETEKQVVEHIDGHLKIISERDQKSRAVLEQMKIDEAQHGTKALEAGGAMLPTPVTKLMGLVSKVMTRSSYWI
ncbi:2-polyprenyl-3-methyl-6-methoxy-1,4-benzoquinone monooxygenase [Methylophaga sp.]|jgi:ubiquinone biosynthesis monooxygenase Coq7|uniref:2-polyprenyl-3-methyl-6-methoxy-1,4-benzoquinone monooxygenase n=1 Tax=Methylophaga sp. TaxID=2024840 RepID=UPI0013FE9507|nr:2-polyprenyl-3-methyl-6-methoxy-1,4-benzoquinone monooxygenase [Methylophaga sp.]MTI64452.1 2-polyprenyl-3-methyl-6-methoxy-1,4-benzoquinone monooxygenase [Methylophaga sp.]